MQIADRVALITSGKRIGAGIARELAGRGARIAVTYHRSRAEAEALTAELQAGGATAVALGADVSAPESCAAVVAETTASLGRLDILINLASIYRRVPYDQVTLADWEEQMAVDLRGAYLCARAAVPHMRAAGEGRIINFSDWVAASGRPRYEGHLTYFVSKAGVIGLTQALALELAEDNILVNAIAPGPILPPAGADADEIEAVRKATPLHRWGGDAEIAKVVAALIESDFVTGETIRVDGGRHIK